MTLESDLLLDRSRLKRHVVFWRVFAVVAVVAALLAVTRHGGGPGMAAGLAGRTHIVRLSVDGVITDNAKLTDAIAGLAGNPSVAALIVSIDSPGGSVSGGEGLHDAIAKVAARKPVVAVMRGTAASAGYMIAAPAARIFARQSTITGSIGVVMQLPEVSGLLAKVGVGSNQIVSGPMKGQPDITQPLQPPVRAYLQGMIDDLYGQFVTIVADGRHMDPARVRALADGRAYTGRQAMPLGLIDQYGGEYEARQWLADQRHVAMAVPVADLMHKPNRLQRLLGADSDGTAGSMFDGVVNSLLGQRVTLDGPLALWQPGG